MKRLNADTKVHLAHVQTFFVNWKVLLEKKYFALPFREINNNKITTRCLSNFKGPIVSYLSAALSCEQRPFFLVTLLFSETFLRDPKLNPENRPNREHRRKRIP